ncbi:MAG: hypothetical protein AAB513_00730 [Patescibacteria group bacterium]
MEFQVRKMLGLSVADSIYWLLFQSGILVLARLPNHPFLQKTYWETFPKDAGKTGPLIGGGIVQANGEVTWWESKGCYVKTPEGRREEISQFFKAHPEILREVWDSV